MKAALRYESLLESDQATVNNTCGTIINISSILSNMKR